MAADGRHHHHDHGTSGDLTRAFALGVGLNLALVVAQVVGGLMARSLALVADAGHNFTDVLGLVLAWWARRLEKTRPTATHTYGLQSASILAALTNAVLLLVTMGAVGWEAIARLREPQEVNGTIVIVVAAAGMVINTVSALPFRAGRRHDLNLRAAFAHLLSDAGMSAGVVVAGLGIRATGATWIDPVVSLAIVAFVIHGTRGLLRDSLNLALHAVPAGVDLRAVHDYLTRVPGVGGVHDLHVWALSTTETALTVHLVLQPGVSGDDVLGAATEALGDQFGIRHVTIQVEPPPVAPLHYRKAF